MKIHILILATCQAFMILGTAICYPLDKLEADMSGLKNETRYPNGTIVGKYSYTDNEGTPIHVKYYADNSSYGVELKSIKVMEDTTWQPNNYDTLQPIKTPIVMGSQYLTIHNAMGDNVNKNLEEDGKQNANKIKKYSDYETFYRNDIKTPRQCDNKKIKVYSNKEKRMIRQALDNYQVVKYCDRL